jgi:hypothetical protein
MAPPADINAGSNFSINSVVMQSRAVSNHTLRLSKKYESVATVDYRCIGSIRSITVFLRIHREFRNGSPNSGVRSLGLLAMGQGVAPVSAGSQLRSTEIVLTLEEHLQGGRAKSPDRRNRLFDVEQNAHSNRGRS